jgi:hypothetical protein
LSAITNFMQKIKPFITSKNSFPLNALKIFNLRDPQLPAFIFNIYVEKYIFIQFWIYCRIASMMHTNTNHTFSFVHSVRTSATRLIVLNTRTNNKLKEGSFSCTTRTLFRHFFSFSFFLFLITALDIIVINFKVRCIAYRTWFLRRFFKTGVGSF